MKLALAAPVYDLLCGGRPLHDAAALGSMAQFAAAQAVRKALKRASDVPILDSGTLLVKFAGIEEPAVDEPEAPPAITPTVLAHVALCSGVLLTAAGIARLFEPSLN